MKLNGFVAMKVLGLLFVFVGLVRGDDYEDNVIFTVFQRLVHEIYLFWV